jgi:hypothetical protein
MEPYFDLKLRPVGATAWSTTYTILPIYTSTSDPIASQITFPSINQDYNLFRQSLYLGSTSFFNYSLYDLIYPCELDGLNCQRLNASFINLYSYRLYSIDRLKLDKFKCNAAPITFPASFSGLKVINITAMSCMHSINFAVPFPNLTTIDLSNCNLNSSFLNFNFTLFTPALQTLVLNFNYYFSFTQGFLLPDIPPTLTFVSLIQCNVTRVQFSGPVNIQSLYLGCYGSCVSTVYVDTLPQNLVTFQLRFVTAVFSSATINFPSSLQVLDLDGTFISGNYTLSLPTTLVTLKIILQDGLTRLSPADFSAYQNLTTLMLSAAGYVTMPVLQSLTYATSLTDLYIARFTVSWDLVSWLPVSVKSLHLMSIAGTGTLPSNTLNLVPLMNLRNLTFNTITSFPSTNLIFKFPALEILSIFSCNLLHVNGIKSVISSLQKLVITNNMYYTSSLNGINFTNLSQVELSGQWTTIPDSFANISTSVRFLRFSGSRLTLPNQLSLQEVRIGDHIQMLDISYARSHTLPKISPSSKLIFFQMYWFLYHYFLTVDDLFNALPPSVLVRIPIWHCHRLS